MGSAARRDRQRGLPGELVGASAGRVYVCAAAPPADPATPEGTSGCRSLEESYVSSPQADFSPLRVPKGRYFMMGDNRSNSDDSRRWGPIRRSQILGLVFATYWPLQRISVY